MSITDKINDTDTYVYCTKCITGKELYLSLISEEDVNIPNACKDCYPYDMEDSKPLKLRTNYKALTKN